jgi:hypothetical protein
MMPRTALVFALVAFGWSLGRAQSVRPQPDFEIVVNAPGGRTTVECLRGCELVWAERGLNPNADPQAQFTFSCTAGTCASGKVAGWIRR